MGVSGSKPDAKSDMGISPSKLDDNLKTCLGHHRSTVYGIAQCVESYVANVELILQSSSGHRTTCDDSTNDSKSTTYRDSAGRVISPYDEGANSATHHHEDGDGTMASQHDDEDGTVNSQYDDGDGTVTSKYEDEVGTLNSQYDDGDGTVTNKHDVRTLLHGHLWNTQNSLHCQSKALQETFKALNACIFAMLYDYNPDSGTSVDLDHERNFIVYENTQIPSETGVEESLQARIAILEKANRKIKADVQRVHCDIESITNTRQWKLQEKENTIQKFKQENEDPMKHTKEEKVRELESDTNSLRINVAALKTYSKTLKRQLEDQERNKAISIQLYYQCRGDLMSKVMDELKAMLASRMGMELNEVKFIVCQNEGDVRPDIPLLVLCINASRLGTDAETALHNLKVSSKVSVLIFHHKDAHALPNQSSARVLTGPEFRELGGIFDIAFLSDKGIYPCKMNNTAISGIINFLKPSVYSY